ncbi:MAG: hypothetical protein WAV93_02450 [Bacteroidales bacterium]
MAKYNRKYSEKIANKIFSLIEEDSYTVAEICANVGISARCYYYWINEFAEFAHGIKKSRETFAERTLVECERSLVKLINGYDYEEVKTVMIDSGKPGPDGKTTPKIKERTVIKKHIIPSLPAIIHFQTNRDPENWKNRQTNELTGKGGKDLFEGLSNEELEERIAELEKKLAD